MRTSTSSSYHHHHHHRRHHRRRRLYHSRPPPGRLPVLHHPPPVSTSNVGFTQLPASSYDPYTRPSSHTRETHFKTFNIDYTPARWTPFVLATMMINTRLGSFGSPFLEALRRECPRRRPAKRWMDGGSKDSMIKCFFFFLTRLLFLLSSSLSRGIVIAFN